jgi:hypothetical protein
VIAQNEKLAEGNEPELTRRNGLFEVAVLQRVEWLEPLERLEPQEQWEQGHRE